MKTSLEGGLHVVLADTVKFKTKHVAVCNGKMYIPNLKKVGGKKFRYERVKKSKQGRA
jgi:hypothetical protein